MMVTQTAGAFKHSVIYFNPEANVGEGATPTAEDSIQETNVRRVPLSEELPPTTQTNTETTPPSTTH